MILSDGDRLAKRNSGLLLIAQSLSGAIPSIIIALGGLVGQSLAPSPTLATVPVSLYSFGLAAGTLPAAYIMRRYGRRFGYLFGASIGIFSGLLATQGIVLSSFWLFCLATFLAGFNGAYVQSYRFAATDGASPALRPILISKILVGGLIAAIIGPQLMIWTKDSLQAYPLAGSFLSQAVLVLLTLPALLLLKPSPMPLEEERKAGRKLVVILCDRRFVLAVSAGIVSYGLMAFLMTAAPIAMVGCGFTVGQAILGIQWHVLGMFAPSLITGKLIAHFGKEKITAIGLALIVFSGLVALAGLDLAHFWGSLILLGVGWNFSFIGATAMIADCHTQEERAKVQGTNDFLIFGAAALASFSAGGMLTANSWQSLNWVVFPFAALILAPLLRRLCGGKQQPVS